MKQPTKVEHIKRFNELPVFVRVFLDYPSIRNFWLPALPTVFGLVCGFIGLLAGNVIYMMAAPVGMIGTAAYLIRYLEVLRPFDIDNDGDDEPVFNQMNLFGYRTPEIVGMGLYMSMPGAKWTARSYEQFNDDMVIHSVQFRLNVMSKPESNPRDKPGFYQAISQAFGDKNPGNIKVGGACEITIGVTYDRDWRNGHAMLDFDDVGEEAGALDIIRDSIEADNREIGRRITWWQAAFATDLMSAHLISKLSGINRWPTAEHGGATAQATFAEKALFDNPTPEYIDAFLTWVKTNGVPYVRGLGLRIRRVEVKSVDPIGKLKGAAEAAAMNILRREAQLQDTDTLIKSVERLEKKFNDGSLSHKDLINAVQVDEEGSRVKKDIKEFDLRGIEKLGSLAEQVAKIMKGGNE